MSETDNNLDELLSAYIDGELTDAERAVVEARLERDPAACELVADLRSLSGTLKSLPREVLAEDLRGAVLSQMGNKQVSLPRAELSMARRLMWPALAIAAALMLMFIQGNGNRQGDDVAKVEVRGGEMRDRVAGVQPEAAFDAPEELAVHEGVAAPEAAAAPATAAPPVADERLLADADAPEGEDRAGAVRSELVDESSVAARRLGDEMDATATAVDAELEGVVHLTLTDFRSGAERFNRLLLSNGVQLVDGQPLQPAASPAAPSSDAMSADGAAIAGALSTRSAAPAAGVGGAMPSASAVESTSESGVEPEPEMVLVEAPPEQIAQILYGCAQDTEAIEEVAVDPTASGMNNTPEKQRLSGYQQYSRAGGSRGQAKGAKSYDVTPSQQGAIAVFNSLPQQQAEPTEANVENQPQQGWAARFYGGQQPVQPQELNWQYNQYRDQYFSSQSRQQQVAKGESLGVAQKLAKDKSAVEQPMRVLFLLHPSAEAARK